MTLRELGIGQKAVINKVNGTGPFRKRLLEMGFIVGQEIISVKKAPLSDPVEYKILNYFVSLRNSEAELVEVTPMKNGVNPE